MKDREHRRLILIKYCKKYLSQSNIIMKPFILNCLERLERKQALKTKDINKLTHLLTYDLKMSKEEVNEYFKPLTIKIVKHDSSNSLESFFQ